MNRINVKVWPAGEAGSAEEPIDVGEVNYISLVNGETYGIPALISEERVKTEGLPVRILYINPENVVAIDATRVE